MLLLRWGTKSQKNINHGVCSLIFPGGFWRDSQRVPGVSRTLWNSWSFFKGGEASGQMGWTACETGSRTGLRRTGWLSRQRSWAEFSLVEDFKVSAPPTPGCPYFESVHLQGASVGPACPPTSAVTTTFRSKPPFRSASSEQAKVYHHPFTVYTHFGGSCVNRTSIGSWPSLPFTISSKTKLNLTEVLWEEDKLHCFPWGSLTTNSEQRSGSPRSHSNT